VRVCGESVDYFDRLPLLPLLPLLADTCEPYHAQRHKLFWETAGSQLGCRVNATHHRWPGTARKITHNPPLVFDLHVDPAEAIAIDPPPQSVRDPDSK
jgi:hypothetical protein